MKGYCGQVKNRDTLNKCASGGLVTALIEDCLNRGGVCYGVAYTPDLYGAEYIRISQKSEIHLLQGSKYVKVPLTSELLNSLCEDLKKGLYVVFTGLPCDLYDVTLHLEKENINTDNLLKIDLKCNGPAPCEALSQYVKGLEEENKSKAVRIITPYKNPSCLPVLIRVDFENGKSLVRELSKTDFGVAFDYCKEEKCYYCAYKGENHKADMTVSNFWGIKVNHPAFNQSGCSYAYVYTKKGEEALENLKDFNLFSDDAEKRVSSLPVHTTTPEKIKEYEYFKKNFNKYGLFKAVKKQKGFILKIKRLLTR